MLFVIIALSVGLFRYAGPGLPNLHDDPRWDAFLRTMGLADDQLK